MKNIIYWIEWDLFGALIFSAILLDQVVQSWVKITQGL